MNGSPPTPPRRLLLIANPIAGGGRSRQLAPALAAALQARGLAAQVHWTTGAGDAGARAAAAGPEPWDGLVAVGGDGTLNEVLNGMPDPTRPLGVLPVGTANVLALELGLPRAPAAVAAMLAHGHTRALAIGTAGDRRFLLFCGTGLDGAVVHRLAAVRTGTLGKRKWLGPILHVVRRWPRFALAATFPDGTRLDGLHSVLVTRVRNYGGVVRLVPGIDAGDGLLHVLCFRQRSRRAWLWLGARAFVGRLRPGPDLLVHATTAVRIDGEAPVQIDGDAGGHSPIDIGLLPVRARLFAPPPRGGH
ncbi:MAG: diacylglycerol kinase family lipid kinase [Planctomycetes bacterium]|nr:diacylglycerol kinase family lipid kinase [Planctomycetota bacterium]